MPNPQLLVTVAEVLLDGSTPPVAAPFLTELFERAVGTGAVELTSDAKVRRAGNQMRLQSACIVSGLGLSVGGECGLRPLLHVSSVLTVPHLSCLHAAHVQMRLVPRIARVMRAGNARTGLREREAVVLLRASLDPDALLEAGRLAEFHDTLLVGWGGRGGKGTHRGCSKEAAARALCFGLGSATRLPLHAPTAARIPPLSHLAPHSLQSVLGMCRDMSSDTAASLLRSFDGSRFAMLCMEGGVRPGRGEEEEGGSSAAARVGTSVSW